MHLAGNGGHQGDRIGFAMGQGPDRLHDVLHLRPPDCDDWPILARTAGFCQKETTFAGSRAAAKGAIYLVESSHHAEIANVKQRPRRRELGGGFIRGAEWSFMQLQDHRYRWPWAILGAKLGNCVTGHAERRQIRLNSRAVWCPAES
jgi:hypothetical protein